MIFRWRLCLVSLMLVLVLLAQPGMSARAQVDEGLPVTVLSVIDGFTVRVVSDAGSEGVVRLIGIIAPENPAPGIPPGCFGPESTARLTELALGRQAMLEYDTGREDRAGRLLGYLWLLDEAGAPWLLNERLAAEGYVRALPAPPNVRYTERLSAAEESARSQGLGLWTACPQPSQSGSLMPVPPEPGNPVPPTLLPGRPQVCDASYPTVCIPPPPPILTCDEIKERRFRVLPPDPHRLDPDQNGLGCED